MSKYAPPGDGGMFAYVVTTSSWAKERSRIIWASSLTHAKRTHGWTRQLHTSVTVRRATAADLAGLEPTP